MLRGFVEPSFRVICSAILEQCNGNLPLGNGEEMLLLGAGGGRGTRGRVEEVAAVIGLTAVHTYMRSMAGKHLSHPSQVLSNILYFSYSVGRVLLFASTSIVRQFIVLLTQSDVGGKFEEERNGYFHNLKWCRDFMHADEVGCYFFENFCFQEATCCYIFASPSKIIMGMYDEELNSLSLSREVLLGDIVEVSTSFSASFSNGAACHVEESDAWGEMGERLRLINLLTIVIDDSQKNSAAKMGSIISVADNGLRKFSSSVLFSVVLKGLDFEMSLEMSRSKYHRLMNFLQHHLPVATFSDELLYSTSF